MQDIVKLPVCSGDKPLSLRYVFDKINVNLRGLESLGMDSEQCGGLLILITVTKLLNDLCLRIIRETDKQVWKIEELLAIIKKEVEAREATEYVEIHQVEGPRMPAKLTPTASARVTSGSSVRCVYCNDS